MCTNETTPSFEFDLTSGDKKGLCLKAIDPREKNIGWDFFDVSCYWKVLGEVEYGVSPYEGKNIYFFPTESGDSDFEMNVNYASDIGLQADFLKMLENGKNADVTFHVKGEEIKAHKNILSARSTYFTNMFESDTQENLSGEVQVPDASPAAFRGMLHFLYGGTLPKKVEDIVLELFVIADKRGLDTLKRLCKSNICRNLGPANVVDILFFAERLNCEVLKSQAKLVFAANIRAVEQFENNREKLKSDPDFLLKLIVCLCDG